MQCFAQIVNPSLNEEGLKSLANALKMPGGWTYKAKKLQNRVFWKLKEVAKLIEFKMNFKIRIKK